VGAEKSRGIVVFVGTGPGDPTLRTERASRRIAEADEIAGDDVPIASLVEKARAGRRVVRLVHGDPVESPAVVACAVAVAAAGVAIEIVPGISASAAAGAFAGVVGPARELAQWVPSSGLRAALSRLDAGAVVTVVIDAGEPSQRVIVGPASVVAPFEVVAGGSLLVAPGAPIDALRWAENRPLFGQRILVTRAREQAGSMAAALRDAGAEPVVVPTIEIHPPSDPEPLARALHTLRRGAYGWVAFTSANGVERTWEALIQSGGDARVFGAAKLAAIGPATARALEGHGLRPDVVAREFRGENLAEEILSAIRARGPSAAAPRVLLARAAVARDVLPDALRGAGCEVDVVPAYETRPPAASVVDTLGRDLESGGIDVVTFTSSSTVENLCDLLGPRAAAVLAGVRVASIGPVTTATARERGLRVDVTAREYTVSGLVEALVAEFSP
jgi:uroporphyrinogen III methyltransferase/synthase